MRMRKKSLIRGRRQQNLTPADFRNGSYGGLWMILGKCLHFTAVTAGFEATADNQ